jgi:peptide chain release factor 1
MKISKKDLKVEYMRGQGPGGQHKNKTDSACRLTHLPTGEQAYADERSQKHSYRLAMSELTKRLRDRRKQQIAAEKKARRDHKVKNPERAIRTYDFKAGLVYDHRSGKTATVKDILKKGKLDLLRE